MTRKGPADLCPRNRLQETFKQGVSLYSGRRRHRRGDSQLDSGSVDRSAAGQIRIRWASCWRRLVGVPMYADIFGTIPVAEALLAKGAQLGTILAFMMAVTTLSLPSMIMLKKAVKPKLLAVFIAVCTIGIILVGYLFNGFQGFLI